MSKGIKAAIFIVILIFAGLFGLTTFTSSSAAESEAEKYFSKEDIHKGQQFSFERRLLSWSGTFLHLAVLGGIVLTGFARKLANVFLGWTRGHWLAAVFLVGAFCFLADEAVGLLLGLLRLEHLRSWGMTRRPIADWLAARGLGVTVAAVTDTISLLGLYLLLRYLPKWWWLLASVGALVLGAVYIFLLPIWISPLFNTFTPLNELAHWAYLQKPIQDLARRARVPVQDVLMMDASRQGSHTNAYFTGFGSTRQIVLYDNLLKAHTRLSAGIAARFVGLLGSPAGNGPFPAVFLLTAKQTLGQYELESILAHEMGHWQHNHIVKGLALAGLGALVGFFLLAQILAWAVDRPPFHLRSPSDPAGIPFILLLTMLGLWLAAPLENVISRHFERQADQASLDLAGRPDVFIEAEKRLARDNLSNVAPNLFSVWLFYTHPPALERIRMAEKWRKKNQ